MQRAVGVGEVLFHVPCDNPGVTGFQSLQQLAMFADHIVNFVIRFVTTLLVS